MPCEECGKRAANVHVTQIVNGQAHSVHLCSECARELGEYHFFQDPGAMLQSLFAGLAGHPTMTAPVEEVCPNCRTPFRMFQETGMLGCPECYSTFAGRLEPVMQRLHGGSTRHRGKVPTKADRAVHAKRRLADLHQELDAAVQREAYEEAARLRDEIRRIEQEHGDHDH